MKISQLHQLFLDSSGVSTDTRNIKNNNLFFALSGTNFNGNLFATEALKKGASKVVIDDEKYRSENSILVEDCLIALQDLAHYHRKHLGLKIISITGSNGKTTTKELLTQVLQQKYKVVATTGNLNNHIGVPLTLLSMNKETEIGIVEMGANHQGEIKSLCQIAEPNYGYITNFGKAHLEGFGGIEGVIKGKSELYDYLIRNEQTVFIHIEDETQVEKTKDYKKRISIGSSKEANYPISSYTSNFQACITYKDTKVSSQLTGSYNSFNMAAATGIGLYFKVEMEAIQDAIKNYTPSNNRSQRLELNANQIILDAYNANPSSMILAIENIASLPAKKKVLILGDMFEVGPTSHEEHQHIVDLLENMKIDLGLICGENFYKTKTEKVLAFQQFEDLKVYLSKKNIQDSTILIKGSRGMQLERLLDLWE
ncbi:MAG: UDP-N-acetylmuramoyl-tripeptide--D-alanyl-D-alanine ligase [Mesonia sp.]|uniref:UDP-N-acetylmuramoyl-tripeptide--D-alanyl-D- alanine ligase n=1 Tax=Mesonia sp. TaxID=1960830 RepID=UPI003F9E9951